MGGNALKNIKTKRMNKEEFIKTKNIVLNKIYERNLYAEVVKFYKNKQDFGDIDIVVEFKNPQDIVKCIKTIQEDLKPLDTFKNGNVFSFELNYHQVDLIFVPEEYFQSTLNYLSYNDLFNLLGRIAHKMGFKLGHKGLMVVIKNGDYKLGEVILTQNLKEILGILGLDYKKYQDGFDNLEDIFNFVISSKFFDKSIFDYDNLNHINRIRNKKRKTYKKFLKYIDSNNIINKSNIDKSDINKSNINKSNIDKSDINKSNIDKSEYVKKVLKLYPDAQEKIKKLQEKLKKQQEVSKIFNGNIVKRIKNVDREELGKWMRHFKKKYDLDFWLQNKDKAEEIIKMKF